VPQPFAALYDLGPLPWSRGSVLTDSDKLRAGGCPAKMKLFGRKGASAPPAGEPAEGTGIARASSHRLTLELARAETFATMLANSRASRAIEVTDLLAGMYICNWERLSQYWQDEDQAEIEGLLRGICRISPQRWHMWLDFYDRAKQRPRLWSTLRKRKNGQPSEKMVPSGGLAAVLKKAEEIAPFRDSSLGRSIPILTSECVLLCIVRSFGTEVSRRLYETGLDAVKLEREALIPRRAPLV